MNEIFSQISVDLKQMLIDSYILLLVISVGSVIITQAIKDSIEKVFLKKKCPAIMPWLASIGVSLLVTILIVLVFDGQGSLWATVNYIITLWIASWAVTVLGYSLIVRILFSLAKTLYLKVKDNETDTETELIQSQKELEDAREALRLKAINSALKKTK
jgi:uncharacterized membrane protein YiaA